jgi:uncharacterized protein DUF6263
MKLLAPLLLFVLTTSVVRGQTSLEYNLKIGDVFTIKQNADQVITQNLDGASHEITNSINGVLNFEVVGKQEENYEIELKFKDLNLKMTSSIQGELMNVKASEVNEDDVQSKIFNTLLNSPVVLTLSKTGDILSVEGGDSLVSRMAHASGLEDEFSLNLMKKSLEKEFGSKALSESYEQMTFIYPASEVNIGDTWENEYTGKFDVKNTWTLNELSETNATIKGTGKVEINVTEPNTTMKLTGSQTTEISTDIVSGLILKMRVEGISTGASTLVQLGEQEIPTTIKSTITYELIQ